MEGVAVLSFFAGVLVGVLGYMWYRTAPFKKDDDE